MHQRYQLNEFEPIQQNEVQVGSDQRQIHDRRQKKYLLKCLSASHTNQLLITFLKSELKSEKTRSRPLTATLVDFSKIYQSDRIGQFILQCFCCITRKNKNLLPRIIELSVLFQPADSDASNYYAGLKTDFGLALKQAANKENFLKQGIQILLSSSSPQKIWNEFLLHIDAIEYEIRLQNLSHATLIASLLDEITSRFLQFDEENKDEQNRLGCEQRARASNELLIIERLKIHFAEIGIKNVNPQLLQKLAGNFSAVYFTFKYIDAFFVAHCSEQNIHVLLNQISKSFINSNITSAVEIYPHENKLNLIYHRRAEIKDSSILASLLPSIPDSQKVTFIIEYKHLVTSFNDIKLLIIHLPKHEIINLLNILQIEVRESEEIKAILTELLNQDKLPFLLSKKTCNGRPADWIFLALLLPYYDRKKYLQTINKNSFITTELEMSYLISTLDAQDRLDFIRANWTQILSFKSSGELIGARLSPTDEKIFFTERKSQQRHVNFSRGLNHIANGLTAVGLFAHKTLQPSQTGLQTSFLHFNRIDI